MRSRNLIFISHAASYCEERGIRLIWYGADYSDYENRFPDCYQEWVGRLNKLLEINGSMPLRAEAPLLGLTKQSILGILESRGLDKHIYSGYDDPVETVEG